MRVRQTLGAASGHPWRPAVILATFIGLVATQQTFAQTPLGPSVDPLTTLARDLGAALRTDRAEDLAAIPAPTLPASDLLVFLAAADANATDVVVRERARRVTNASAEMILDVFVVVGRGARLATWQVLAQPRGPDRAEVVRLVEIGSLGGLIPLALDTTEQFLVTDLAIGLPDLTLTMRTGTAFASSSAHGVTALVLLGRVSVTFTPGTTMEEEQMRLFAGAPVLANEADAVFIRLNSREFSTFVAREVLVPAPVVARDVRRAAAIFDDRAPLSFTIGLGHIRSGVWSLDPPAGGAVVEFRTSRFGWLTYTRTPREAEDIALFDRVGGRFIAAYTSAVARAERGDHAAASAAAYDITHYAVDVEVDPDAQWIAGRAVVRLERAPATASLLTFKLAESLEIISVTSPAHGRLLATRVHGRDQFLVAAPDDARTLELEIQYAGALAAQPLEREAIAPLGAAPQSQSPTGLIINPTARFLYSTRRAWYPQAQSTDHATASVTVRVPAEFSVVASGAATGAMRLVSAGRAPERRGVIEWRQFSFEADRPLRYLAVVVSDWVHVGATRVSVPALAPVEGDLARTLDGRQDVTVTTVATPVQAGRNHETPERAARVFAFYAEKLGEAPFPTLTVAAADDAQPGGHAPAYLALIQQPLPSVRVTWATDPVAFGQYPEFFLAHEIAHQWWGQAVGSRTYHDQWISEGLAQYFAVLFLEFDRGADAANALVASMHRPIAAVAHKGPIALGHRIGQIDRDSRAYRAILYNKSAVVLDMLRRMMGDDAFFAGLRAFYQQWRFRAAGTEDFQRAMQRVARLPLDRFFAQWIGGTSAPRLKITTRTAADGRSATVRVEQLGEVFDFPLDVAVDYADGRSERTTLVITEASSGHVISLSGPVRRIAPRDPQSLASW